MGIMDSWCTSKNSLSDVDNSSQQNNSIDSKRFEDIIYNLKSYVIISDNNLKFVKNLNHDDKNKIIELLNTVLKSAIELALDN